MLMCKASDDNIFVRYVNAAPFPIVVLAYDNTLVDIARFCTQSHTFSIFGDPTFTLGDFDVTITTYCHLLLESKLCSNGKSPVMIGSIFVHMKKDFSAYHFFTSSLVSLNPEIPKLKSFGSNGEALCHISNSCSHEMLSSFQGKKLCELGVPSPVAKEIVYDVMGWASGSRIWAC